MKANKKNKSTSLTVEGIDDKLIDLLNNNRGSEPIGKQWQIEIKPPKISRLFGNFGIKIRKNVQLTLKDIICPEYLKKAGSLFSILIDGKEFYFPKTECIEMELVALSTSFQVNFNTSSIVDCYDKQLPVAKKHEFGFTLYLKDSQGEAIDKKDIKFNVIFRDVKAEPVLDFSVNPSEIEFNNNLRVEKIGSIKIKNCSPLDYFPDLSCNIRFEVEDTWTGLSTDCIFIKTDSGVQNIKIDNLTRKQQLEWGLYADYTKIGNPIGRNKHAFNLITNVTYCQGNDNKTTYALPSQTKSFTVIRNTTKPQLVVTIIDTQNKDNRILVKNDGRVRLKTNTFLPGNHMGYYNKIELANQATCGDKGSGVAITGFTCTPHFEQESTIAVFRSRQSLEQVFSARSIQTDDQFILSSDMTNKVRVVEFGFDEDNIKSMITSYGRRKDYNGVMVYDISFSYWEMDTRIVSFATLPNSFRKEFKLTIEVPIYREPNLDWLGIDFGTSAIISKYADSEMDLRNIKRRMFIGEEDSYEPNSTFLSSNVILNNTRAVNENSSELLSEHPVDVDAVLPAYDSLAVMLSPTSQREDKNIMYVLPCVKMLVGYDKIPNIRQYENFSFNVKGENGIDKKRLVEEVDGDIVYSELGDVETILREVYLELFSYYIRSAMGNEVNNINNIVLTVPNTFSPNHFSQLRRAIDESFKNYEIRNLRFVSESDAVACFYQTNWAVINHSSTVERSSDEAILEQLKMKENVLVFDMGAGTLDLTYYTRCENKITIRGRIGISKAGNYLDCVLAKILAKKIPELEVITNPDMINDENRLDHARLLKTIIKNELKPKLSEESATIVLKAASVDEGGFRGIRIRNDKVIRVDEILNDPDFKEYIESCTGKLINNFFAFFDGLSTEDFIDLDTVIVSGRSSKLVQIQDGLKQILNQKVRNAAYNLIDMSTVMVEDKSKTAVVEGAMDLALLNSDGKDELKIESNNILANYGVIYQDNYGETHYLELLNPRKEVPNASVTDNGLTINQYKTADVTLLHIGGNRELTLLQTYSANTLNDWKKGNLEYITEMEVCRLTPNMTREGLRLHVEVDAKNSLRLFINGQQTKSMAPSRIDVNSETNKYSMWPTLAVSNN